MQLYNWEKKNERPDFCMRRNFEAAYLKVLGQQGDPKKLPPDAHAEIAWQCYFQGFMDHGTYEEDRKEFEAAKRKRAKKC